MSAAVATPLRYEDEALGAIDLPGGTLCITRGVGSGLARSGDGRIWAIGDRGPNLKVKLAVERYGCEALARHAETDGAKVMPRLDIGPAISELALDGDAVRIARTIPLRDRSGRPLSGLPPPGGLNGESEPALTLAGETIEPDPAGVDSEGLAAAADGSFWVGDEYGPSVLRVAADGTVLARWVPCGSESLFEGADYPIVGRLPPIAAKRRLNRGFEALALSPDERRLYLVFQSPLSHPDLDAHRKGRHVRLWRLDADSGEVEAQFLYPLDAPETFQRDRALGPFGREDIKVSELAAIGPDRLLVLERGSATTKICSVDLDPACALPAEHLDMGTRPTVEELSAEGGALPVLTKRLVLNTDEMPELDADLEGLVALDGRTLLLVNDNDFGTEGVPTRFWRVALPSEV